MLSTCSAQESSELASSIETFFRKAEYLTPESYNHSGSHKIHRFNGCGSKSQAFSTGSTYRSLGKSRALGILTLLCRRVASFGIYSSCAAAYIYYLIPEIEIEEEASEGDLEEENEQSANDDEDFDDTEPDEDSIFIPLGFAKRKERSFYRGSDPEWQEFIKLANDHERHKRVQQDLVGLIMTHVNANANFSRSLGGTLKASKVWLDIQFPSGPPPEFERTG